MQFLLASAIERDNRTLRFQAAIHGVKLDGESKEDTAKKAQTGTLFGSPDMYEKMTQEERDAATKRLMSTIRKMGLPINNLTE